MKRSLSALVGFGLLAGPFFGIGCSPPKYTLYHSEAGDFSCEVPYGWNVYLDREDEHFLSYNFVGSFDPDFFLALPSIGVRWYGRFQPHTLRDGTIEKYGSGSDFIEKTLAQVYGPRYTLSQAVHEIKVSGRSAKHFIVDSVAVVGEGVKYGVSVSTDGKTNGIVRRHEYTVVDAGSGFYVLVYPATPEGYDKYSAKYNHFVRTFEIKTDGPKR